MTWKDRRVRLGSILSADYPGVTGDGCSVSHCGDVVVRSGQRRQSIMRDDGKILGRAKCRIYLKPVEKWCGDQTEAAQ